MVIKLLAVWFFSFMMWVVGCAFHILGQRYKHIKHVLFDAIRVFICVFVRSGLNSVHVYQKEVDWTRLNSLSWCRGANINFVFYSLI